MENGKQIQKGGENSVQLQGETFIFNQGISEERVRTIFCEMIPHALEDYTKEAYTIANSRVDKLEERIMPRLNDVAGLLPAFSDPAFQVLLRKAQQAAAASERENDYELLSELLVCHVQKGNDRKNRAGINRAIEVIDQIDNDALCALTVYYVITTYRPIAGEFITGLQIFDSLFSKLIYQELPKGASWLDHLDILGAVRLSTTANLKKFAEYLPLNLDGYICAGIKIDSKEYKSAIELLHSAEIDAGIMIPNECLDGYVRLAIGSFNDIDVLGFGSGSTRVPLNRCQKDSLRQIGDLYSKDAELLKKAKVKFVELWDNFSSLQKLRLWWDNIPNAFQITHVGRILAHINAKRCSPEIPDLI